MGLTKAQRRPARDCISLTRKRHHEQGTRGPGACVGVMECGEAGPKAEGLAAGSGAEREEGGGLGKANKDGRC